MSDYKNMSGSHWREILKKKKVFEVAASILGCTAIALMLAGCGQSSSSPATSQSSTSSSAQGSSNKSSASSSSKSSSSASSSSAPSSSGSSETNSPSSSSEASSGASSPSSTAPSSGTASGSSSSRSSSSLTDYSNDPSVPLPKSISPSIPDNASVVAPGYAQMPDGKVVNLSTGKEVTNPKLVGTSSTPPDPGALSNGMNFIPEQVGNVRKQMEKLQQSDSNSDKADTSAYFVSTASYIPDGDYGAFWGSNSNGEVFYDAQGQPFVQQAKGVIDVSAWNGQINWQELQNEGVQGAIIRLDYGSYNGYDSEALNNIKQCMSLGIPIGVYVYSYAYDSNSAYQEGSYAASLLQQAGVSPSDLPLGIYYDLEPYVWAQHPHPTNPGTYQQIVSNFFAGLSSLGYTNASVYSYPDYLESELNNSYIYQHVGWVASYSSYPGFYQWNTNFRGWQYYDEGTLNGVSGYVDLDAFGYASYEPNAWRAPLNLSSYPAADLPDGDYYIDLASNLSTSLQAPSSQEGIQMNSANGN
ncbi:MAG: hypothetical protein J6P06_00795, partial [Aeriscardovia sp.]|nr:hypothetical protein [Aeriscardovia sp.]